jgi:hypothetical protein
MIKMPQRWGSIRVFVSLSWLPAIIVLCMFASTAQGQTATYSDSYVVDTSGMYYDADNDAWVFPSESWTPPVLVGVGVTDADYTSYSESVATTFYGMSGTVTSTSYDTPSARVEVTLGPPTDDNEYDYQVQTVHRYWVDEHLLNRGPKCEANRPCMQTASYGARPLGFFELFTEATITVRNSGTSYHYNGIWLFVHNMPLLKTCFYNKVCGSCGFLAAGYGMPVWSSCPTYIGVRYVRWHMRWGGSFCSPYELVSGYIFCS